jgi:hypothetical protein
MRKCVCNSKPHNGAHPPPPPPSSFTRCIHPHEPFGQLRYSAKSPPACTHLGQLKLLLSEIEFLTPFYGRSLRVIYAGAAPGVHMPILAGMFPTMHFILVDPARSMISNGEYANIEVVRDFMTDDLAARFAMECSRDEDGDPMLVFISDVRVGPPSGGGESDEAQQLRIQRDMDAQRRWVELMRPLSSMLKFRLPWSIDVRTLYLSGRILLPVYGKQLTHESRLVVPRGASLVEYDNLLYERQMAFFNRRMRPAIQPASGRCYDCTAFRWIVRDYYDAAFSAAAGSTGTSGGRPASSFIDDRCHCIEQELDQLKRKCWQQSSR